MIKTQQKETLDTIQSAVDKLVDFVKPTLGPASNKVIIDKNLYKMTVDDGVQIARDFELEDPAENAVVRMVRETAIKTNDRVGDGTTTSLIILQALLKEINKYGRKDFHNIVKELQTAQKEAVDQLKKQSQKIESRDDLKKVSLISFDDENVADMLAGLYHDLGPDALIAVEKSPTMDITSEMTEGLKIDRGYVSSFMVNNPNRMEAVIENPRFLITDYRLTEAKDITPIMDQLIQNQITDLVIICENIEQQALATALINSPLVSPKGRLFTVAVVAPNVDDRNVLLSDIALVTGAKLFTNEQGRKVDNAVMTDLGHAERFICRQNESVILRPKGDEQAINSAIKNLKEALENEEDPRKKEKMEKRLGRFTNKIATVKVGAKTENEQKHLKYKVEDAVHSLRSAYRDGIVCGAGIALTELETSSPIMNEALKYPFRQLFANMGQTAPELKKGEAINIVTEEKGDFREVGVVDPVQTLIAGVESAVSIASVLLTSSGILVEHEEKNDNS